MLYVYNNKKGTLFLSFLTQLNDNKYTQKYFFQMYFYMAVGIALLTLERLSLRLSSGFVISCILYALMFNLVIDGCIFVLFNMHLKKILFYQLSFTVF